MSKALSYLAAARPEAATHLLSFYKHSVQALDDKTRHLIQIVTKTAQGTESGLRQYAPKALKAGASKEEILDAVLMAFPAAGLPKVLAAINVLNEVELLPEIETKGEAPEESPVLGRLDDFPLKRMACVNRPSGDLIVYRTGEASAKVYDRRCPHSKANLCDGTDHGDRVECRVHNWIFHLDSGDCVEPGKKGLREVAASVEDGNLILT